MKCIQILTPVFFILFYNCGEKKDENKSFTQSSFDQYVTILGIAQDAGFPQIDCQKVCCKSYYENKASKEMVSCLGLVDLHLKQKWLFEATPDITDQIQVLKEQHLDTKNIIDGVFLTHAHIGHYTGLMYLGREAMGAHKVPVYAMPKMKTFIETNGPWSQLVALENIELKKLQNDSTISLNTNLRVTPFIVPHRDEFSETVGFKIEGTKKSALFIPDIDKWHIWEKDIIEEVRQVDYAFLDATFFKDGELTRPMSEVPHPFIEETVKLFENESYETKSKIYFIHLNHTNVALKDKHYLRDSIQNLGFHFAKEGENFSL